MYFYLLAIKTVIIIFIIIIIIIIIILLKFVEPKLSDDWSDLTPKKVWLVGFLMGRKSDDKYFETKQNTCNP